MYQIIKITDYEHGTLVVTLFYNCVIDLTIQTYQLLICQSEKITKYRIYGEHFDLLWKQWYVLKDTFIYTLGWTRETKNNEKALYYHKLRKKCKLNI